MHVSVCFSKIGRDVQRSVAMSTMCTMLSALIIWSIAHSHVLITAAPQAMLARRRIHNGHNKGIFLALLVSKRLLQCWQHSELVASANFATLFDWSAKLLINGIILFPPLCPHLDLPPINNAWKQLQKECAIFRYILLQQKIGAEGSKQSPIFEGFYGTKADLNLDPHLAVWLKGCQNIALLNLWPDRWSFMQT